MEEDVGGSTFVFPFLRNKTQEADAVVGICLLLEYWELIVGTAAVWVALWFLSGQGG